jgi:hypothetical protein
MGLEFKKQKTVPSMSVVAKLGSFAADRMPIKFEDCRERFATQWGKKTKGFYFKHRKDEGERVALFVLKTEQIVRQRNFSHFAKTNHDTILWVEPSYFWRSCPMRRQLFTLILRGGMNYDPKQDNYEDAMFNQEHLKQTRNAIRRFLYGFTKYVGDPPSGSPTLQGTGWHKLLRTKDEGFVKGVLVKPRGKLYQSSFDLRNALWL